MMANLAVFSESQFISDLREACVVMDAPFSESHTKAVLRAYSDSFQRGAVLWRVTDRPGDKLNYRFYERQPVDTVAIAVKSGFLESNNKLGRLVTSLTARYSDSATQSCDFDAEVGLTKAWIYLGGVRPLDEVLAVDAIPDTIRRHGNLFRKLNLDRIRHVAVDYSGETVNIYFKAPGPLSTQQVTQYVGLAGHPPISDAAVEEMRRFLNPAGFTFAVTMAYDSGKIKRVGIYALKLQPGRFPRLNDKLRLFFASIPSFDEDEMNAVAWSFGNGGGRYVKAERSYCGDLVQLMEGWNSPVSS